MEVPLVRYVFDGILFNGTCVFWRFLWTNGFCHLLANPHHEKIKTAVTKPVHAEMVFKTHAVFLFF